MSTKHETGIPLGFCQCGCGQQTAICTHTSKRAGVVEGQPNWYLRYHRRRVILNAGSCQCGCGRTAAPGSRYLRGHSARVTPPSYEYTPDGVLIPLTRGATCLVSLEDADLWETRWFLRSDGYAGRWEFEAKRRRLIHMHRVVLERMIGRPLGSDELPDHRNNNPLDNRRENLRVATRCQNQWNKKIGIDNTSGYKGVSLDKGRRAWRATIRVNGRPFYLGRFATAEEAGAAYEQAAKIYYGEWARSR